jgi:hypothetical protein
MMTSGGYHGGQISGGHHETSGGGGGGGEANRKRVVRLQKNREAARECRRKKKEYIKCLENRVAVLEVIIFSDVFWIYPDFPKVYGFFPNYFLMKNRIFPDFPCSFPGKSHLKICYAC